MKYKDLEGYALDSQTADEVKPEEVPGWDPDDFDPTQFAGVGLEGIADSVAAGNERKRVVLNRNIFIAIVVNVAILAVLFYLVLSPATDADASMPAHEQVVAEESDVSVRQAQPPPRVPARSPNGAGRSRGNISNVFCRQLDGESVEAWIARVPSYCAPSVGL